MDNGNTHHQFWKDGLLGIGLALLIQVILAAMGGINVFFDVKLAPVIALTAFLGTGFGGRLFENTGSRWAGVLPLLKVAFVSWIISIALIAVYLILWDGLDFQGYLWYFGPTYVSASGSGAVIGFVIASLLFVIFNPSARPVKVALAGIVSSITGFTLVVTVLILLFIPT